MSESIKRPGRRSRLFSLAMVASGLLVLASAVSVGAASPNGSTSPGGGSPPAWGDGAIRVNPDPSVRSLHRQAWDHIKVSPDGKRLVVYFWMGVQECYGLGRVDVVRRDGQLIVKLWTGIREAAAHTTCIELAQLYKTVVHLNRPIIGGGAG